MFAVRAGHLDAVRVLLEAGANVNDTLSDGQSVLVVATANANWELADYLLYKGADPNRAGAGWNALHQTVRTRRMNLNFGLPGPIPSGTVDSVDVIKKMLAKGMDVNARMTRNGMKDGQRNRFNRLGATAFLLAAKITDVEAMKILLEAGANPNIKSAENTTPLMVAAGVDIWNPGEDGGSLTGQENEVLEAVRMCVALGNDVNAVNDLGVMALHGARVQRRQHRRGVPGGAGRQARRTGHERMDSVGDRPRLQLLELLQGAGAHGSATGRVHGGAGLVHGG